MRRIKKIPRRILALTLCICLCIGMGVVAHAANADACTSTPGCLGTFYNGVCFVCGKDEAAAYNTEKDYYEISNAGQLFWFAEKINSGELARNTNAVLAADIDLEGRDWITITETGLYNNEYGTDDGYTGTFDGQNHVIKNLALNSSTVRAASCGLFGTLSGTVKNLGVIGVTFEDGDQDIRAGAVAGQVIKTGTIRNCYVIDAEINPNDHVTGGIAGCVYDGTIENCYVLDSTITGYSDRYGYIVGDSRADGSDTDRRGTVRNCYTESTPAWSTRSGYIETCKQFGDASFRTGEIAYLLSQGTDGSVWGQNDLTEKGYPVLGGTSVPAARYEFLGQNLNIGADLSLKYHILAYYDWTDFKVSSSQSDSFSCGFSESKLGMRFEFNTVATTVTEKTKGESTVAGATAYTFTFAGISPQCFGDGIDAYITFNNEDRASFKGYTVEQNLKQLQTDHADNLQLMGLVDKLLKYGHASEVYTEHNSMTTDYTTNSSATPPVVELPDFSGYTYIKGYTVRFGNENYIKIKCENLPSEYTVSSKMTEGIAPTDFDKDYTFKVMNGGAEVESITLSVNDYLYAISISEVNTEEMTNMKALAVALYHYGGAAGCYAGTGEHIFGEDNLCVFCGANKPNVEIVDGIATIPVTADTDPTAFGDAVKLAVDGKAKVIIISGAIALTAEQQTALADALANATVTVYMEGTATTAFTPTLPDTVTRFGSDHGYYCIENTYYLMSGTGLTNTVKLTGNPTLKLMADISSGNVTSNGTYTLDLNGHTLNFGGNYLEITGGSVIVMDSASGGTISGTNSTGAIQMDTTASLEIRSGIFSGSGRAVSGTAGAQVKITGGEFRNTGERAISIKSPSSKLVIEGNPIFEGQSYDIAVGLGATIDLSKAEGSEYTIKDVDTGASDVIVKEGWALYNGTTVLTGTSNGDGTVKIENIATGKIWIAKPAT